MDDKKDIKRRFGLLSAFLDERLRRLVAAAESEAIGCGGISIVSRATGVSRRAIGEGVKELRHPPRGEATFVRRVRRPGGGRKKAVERLPTLPADLEKLVEPVTRGEPESLLRWTCKSVRNLAEELKRKGRRVSHQVVANMLHDLHYSPQANRKTLEGTQPPERNVQFEYINRKVQRWLARGQPAISVGTKKKELVGDFKNGGRDLARQG